jgi:probable F420-dependent oxidoreductase
VSLRPFRFGFQAARANDPEGWLALARRAESAGYASLLIPDHLGRMSTFPALMAAAAVTERILLGTYVLNQDFRPPGILAQEAASVHLLTNGRLVLGLGAGWNIPEYRQAGLQYDPPGVRVSRFDEYVQVVKGLLCASEPYSFDGQFFHLEGFLPLPKTSNGPPPILIGGGSPRILATAGRLADVISVSTRATPEGKVDSRNVTEQAVDQKVAAIREAAGERFPAIELNMTVRALVQTDDRRAAARQILDAWRRPNQAMAHADVIDEDDLLASPHLALGTPDQIADQFLRMRERWGFSDFEVSSSDFEATAPVIERLAGR